MVTGHVIHIPHGISVPLRDPLSALSAKMVLPIKTLASGIHYNGLRERKAVYEDATKLGTKIVAGYWLGGVKIVRDARGKNKSGDVNWYGNYFEKGIYGQRGRKRKRETSTSMITASKDRIGRRPADVSRLTLMRAGYLVHLRETGR